MHKVYNSPDIDPDVGPTQLLNKVMFNIRYYFCHRGTENFQGFSKDTFKLCYDTETGITYVKKIQDEISKNHPEMDQEIVTRFMPQLLSSDDHPHKLCPVQSYENYISHLNPNINALWQRPLKSKPKSNVWYAAAVLGHNPIEKLSANFHLAVTCQITTLTIVLESLVPPTLRGVTSQLNK